MHTKSAWNYIITCSPFRFERGFMFGATDYQSIGYFGDLRLMRVGKMLFERIVSIGSGIIKRLSHNRAEQVRFNRFLWNESVTSQEIKNTALQSVMNSYFGDHVLAIQDT